MIASTHNNNPLAVIGIYPPSAYAKHAALFSALEDLEPVAFQPVPDSGAFSVDALILCEVQLSDIQVFESKAKPLFACIAVAELEATEKSGAVKFATSDLLSAVLRGRIIQSGTAVGTLKGLSNGIEILASIDSIPLWVKYRTTETVVDLVAEPLPKLDDQQPFLYSHYQRDKFMGLLPLIHFIREQILPINTCSAPLRANFMFDDPNLHWPSFGFINYRALAESAMYHRYHASFATVPLDAWYVHRATAELLKANSPWLSLLIHGNDHIREELAQDYHSTQSIALASEALRRIESLEQRAGIPVARVMAAPHGACVEAMAEALLRSGFDAACISRGSLMHYNPHKSWNRTVGMNPAEFVGSGFPVIPRLKLSNDAQPQIILAAFLDQPVILVGHHGDLRDGYGLLENLSAVINSLGRVSWNNLSSIVQSNYRIRQKDNLAEVALYSRHINLTVPSGVTQLRVRRPWIDSAAEVEMPLEITYNGVKKSVMAPAVSSPFPVATGATVELFSPLDNVIDYQQSPSPPINPWAIARRILAEARDRLEPFVRRFGTSM